MTWYGFGQKLINDDTDLEYVPIDNATPAVSGLVIGSAFVILFSVLMTSSNTLNDNNIGNWEKIVFSALINGTTHQIYSVHSDGTMLTRLTDNNSLSYFSPVASPDGSRIAYESWDSFPNAPLGDKIDEKLYVMNSDGSNKRLLVDSTGGSIDLYYWSPDTSKLAYELSDDIYIINADGSDRRKITNDGHDLYDFVRGWVSNDRIIYSSIEWNGTQVLGTSIKEVSIDGSGLAILLDFDGDTRDFFRLSSDLERISYIQKNGDFAVSLYVMGANGSNPMRLLDYPPMTFSNTVWSPDGKKIAFENWEGDYRQVYVVNVEDGTYRNLSNSKFHDSSPTWSVDGRKIAFIRIISDEEAGIFVMNSDDGSEQRRIAEVRPSFVDIPLVWSK